jgi:lipoyl synthase
VAARSEISDRKPPWLKVKAPGGASYAHIKKTLRTLDLNTVCEEARCPNVGECWGEGTATVMLLGHTCTRGCRFCAVTTGNPGGAVDPREPEHVARAIASLGLRYVVLTMVDRDDLLDGGAGHVADTVRRLKTYQPDLLVETLVGDMGGRTHDIDTILAAKPDVYAHNIEVTRRLTTRIRDRRCGYDLSLEALRYAKSAASERFVKSSVMVGIGETDDEVVETLRDLRDVGVDVVTIGQYLRPTHKHSPVDRYVEPPTFDGWAKQGLEMGFRYVASGPLVRSSYHAAEAFVAAELGRDPASERRPNNRPAAATGANHAAHLVDEGTAASAARDPRGGVPSPELIPQASLVRGSRNPR